MLGGFELGDEALDVSGVDANISECIYNGYFIFYDRHECILELVMIHIELICLECLCGWRKYFGLTLRYLYLRLCGVGRQYSLAVDNFLKVT